MDILALMRERAGDYDCPKCGASLTGCSLGMLRDEDPQFTVQVTCAACNISFVVVLQVRDRDGHPDHRHHRHGQVELPVGPPPLPPIGPDEMLDLHELLRDHQGPLPELLRPPASTSAGG